mmetsp:Transcript_14481/g.25671  ORF Transcript_14481/g.25671 Transcript_14481/m.25671 type:complete len:184 (-) Transcript_14481:4113-4664(-)
MIQSAEVKSQRTTTAATTVPPTPWAPAGRKPDTRNLGQKKTRSYQIRWEALSPTSIEGNTPETHDAPMGWYHRRQAQKSTQQHCGCTCESSRSATRFGWRTAAFPSTATTSRSAAQSRSLNAAMSKEAGVKHLETLRPLPALPCLLDSAVDTKLGTDGVKAADDSVHGRPLGGVGVPAGTDEV